jgi:4-hydroxybenzoate polyprenyltransferase
MKKNNFLFKLYSYQKERFPLAVLLFTTLAVVLSSLAVSISPGIALGELLYKSIFPLIAGIIFMFNIRVLDELKDLEFDNKNHIGRPVQRGLITLKSLFVINFSLILLLILINIFISIYAIIFLLFSILYSFLAGLDFFSNKIRTKFLLYNFLCSIQLLFFQFYIYYLIGNMDIFTNFITYFHLAFVTFNSGIIEVGRKLKVKQNEGNGKDTYSSQMGKKSSAILFFLLGFFTLLFFFYTMVLLKASTFLVMIGLTVFLILMGSIVFYLSSEKPISEKIIALSGIIFYITLHLLMTLNLFI